MLVVATARRMKHSVLRFVVDVAIDTDRTRDDYDLEVTINDVSAHAMIAPHAATLLANIVADVSNRVRAMER